MALRKGHVKADGVRMHLRILQASGWSLRDVEQASGVSRRTLQCILHGSRSNPKVSSVRTETAERILALSELRVSTVKDTKRVSSRWFSDTVDGYLERGVELLTIAEVCGVNKDVLRQRHDHAFIEIANVRKLFEHIRDLDAIANLDEQDRHMEQVRMYMRTCRGCGGTFLTSSKQRRYCSDKCRPTSKRNLAAYKRNKRRLLSMAG